MRKLFIRSNNVFTSMLACISLDSRHAVFILWLYNKLLKKMEEYKGDLRWFLYGFGAKKPIAGVPRMQFGEMQ